MLKQLLDLFPLLVMVITWWITDDSWISTLALTIATAAQWLILKICKQPIPPFQRMVFLTVLVLGSLTLMFDDERFIKWKMSLIYGVFSALLLYGHRAEKNYLQRLMESMFSQLGDVSIRMSRIHWQQLNLVFVGYFITLALVNAYITLYMTFQAWVNFKIIVFLISFILFPLTFAAFIMRHNLDAGVKKDTPDSDNKTPSN